MKAFNLKAALNGEPVMLRDGSKAFIFKNIKNTNVLDFKVDYPLIGMIHNHAAVQTWSLDGRISLSNDCANGDIVGMWEEPKISIKDLPKPFKPQATQRYYYIYGGYIGCEDEGRKNNIFDERAAEKGNCFRTKEDAQKWLNFMKSMME
ncbi:hypothetical protein MY987_03810 [Haemophilus influenzae]